MLLERKRKRKREGLRYFYRSPEGKAALRDEGKFFHFWNDDFFFFKERHVGGEIQRHWFTIYSRKKVAVRTNAYHNQGVFLFFFCTNWLVTPNFPLYRQEYWTTLNQRLGPGLQYTQSDFKRRLWIELKKSWSVTQDSFTLKISMYAYAQTFTSERFVF